MNTVGDVCIRSRWCRPEPAGRRLVGHVAVLLHVQLHAGPIGVDLAVLLDEDIIEDIVGDAVGRIGLHDGGIGQGLVIGQLHA